MYSEAQYGFFKEKLYRCSLQTSVCLKDKAGILGTYPLFLVYTPDLNLFKLTKSAKSLGLEDYALQPDTT